MATLEKIRSKSGLLIVVIGLALLAFIIGDALTNSRNLFGDTTVVAKAGGEKIDYTEYQRKREELNNQLEQARRQNPAQYANFDTQTLSQMAIDQLVAEKLMDAAVEKAGVKSSSSQLRYYMIENPSNPKVQEVMQMLASAGISVATPEDAYNKIFNPKANGLTDAQVAPFQKAWLAAEEETKTMIARQTYQRLVYNTIKANDLDKRAMYNDYVNTTSVDVAFLPYGNLDEKKYPVNDNEIKAAYEEEKQQFMVKEPTKDVSLIAVSVAPSQADRQAAAKLAKETLASLNDSTGNGQVSKEAKKEGVVTERRSLRGSDIPAGAVKDFVLQASNGQSSIVSQNLQGFTIVKMGKTTAELDSVELNLVQVLGNTLPSKVLARLNGGLAIDSLMKEFGADSLMVQKNMWIELFNAEGRTQAMQQAQLDSLENANGRYIVLNSTAQGSVIGKIVTKGNPKTVYDFEEISYVLNPSRQTLADERAKLEKFLLANKTADAFNANAAKAGFTVQNLSLSQSTPALPRMMAYNQFYPNSRQVVRWVMIDGEKGEVSHIFESKDANQPMLYAVAIDGEYEDYVPTSNADVKKYLTDKVRRSKAGDALVKQYKSKAQSLQSAASAMGVEPSNATTFRFGRNSTVADQKIMGRINGSKADKKVVVTKGDDGVYVYQIMGKGKEKFPYDEQSYEQQYFQVVNPQLLDMLKGSKKVTNNAYKFEAGE